MDDALLNRAIQLHQSGHVLQALDIYNQLLAWQPNNDKLLYMSGMANLQTGQILEGIKLLQRTLTIKQDNPPAHNNIGRALQALGYADKALASYETALRIKPDYAEAHYNRGIVLQEFKRLEEALDSFDRALALAPGFAEAHVSRGIVLHALRRPDEALASYERALAIKPDYAEAHNNRGAILHEMMQPDEALASFNRAIALKPDYAKAHLNKAYILLLRGDFAQGWELLEWRFARLKPQFPKPHWQGDENLDGKTILLHAEEGLGDTVQFCRYAASLRDLGAKVILEVQEPLVGLLSGLDGVADVIARGKPRPIFDYHCPMLSLPFALRRTVAAIPQASPYLHADETKVRHWRARMGDSPKLKVGLVWIGGAHAGKPEWDAINEKRNIPLAKLAHALNAVDAEFFSLQKGEAAEADLRLRQDTLWPGGNFHNLMDAVGDFSDTAAIIANLDVVVSVDTAVAHVAAAMAKPTWILNRFATDWRWQLGREDSPWYPSVKLYRQGEDQNWEPVLQRLASDLAALALRTNSPPG